MRLTPPRLEPGIFLSFKGRPEFNPSDYISFRGLPWSEAQRLLPAEWVGWIQDMKTSNFEHVRRRALSAPTMTVHDVYNFYKIRILDHHELEILGESSQQVVNGGHELSFLQARSLPQRTLTVCRGRSVGIVVGP
jgi:hypothetical protein